MRATDHQSLRLMNGVTAIFTGLLSTGRKGPPSYAPAGSSGSSDNAFLIHSPSHSELRLNFLQPAFQLEQSCQVLFLTAGNTLAPRRLLSLRPMP